MSTEEMKGGPASSSRPHQVIDLESDDQLFQDTKPNSEGKEQGSVWSDQSAAVELTIPLPTSRHGWMKMSKNVYGYIVNTLKKKRVEVFERHMDEETKDKFMGAKDTEINKFIQSEAL